MIRKIFIRIIFISLIPLINIYCQILTLDDFETISGWKDFKADAVDINISQDEGITGKCIKFTYDFTKGTGYGGIQSAFGGPIDLPENFEFTFYLKAESPSNNFEIKFLDSTGQNVWWVNNRSYDFPKEWKKIKIKKRHIQFAWGPTIDQSLKRIDRIEFTIASVVGGKGTIWIDDLKFEELPDENQPLPQPTFFATSELSEHPIEFISDNDPVTYWKSKNKYDEFVEIDFHQIREFGGIVINWLEGHYSEDFSLWISRDKEKWEEVYSVNSFKGGKSFIPLKEEETQYLRIYFHNKLGVGGFAIKEIEIKDVRFSSTLNDFFINVAKEYPQGYFPRYFSEQASYWTIVGVNGDEKEALINEDGMVEVDKKSFSIEPFLFVDNKLITWNDIKKEQTLRENYLPIPCVRWNYNNLFLEIEAFSSGKANDSSGLHLVYLLRNWSSEFKKGRLYLVIRPFQVNPYYQWLNITGGISGIDSIISSIPEIHVDEKTIFSLSGFDNFGATSFDEGNLIELLSKDKFPESKFVYDQKRLASGVIKYDFELRPEENKLIYLAIPFYGEETLPGMLKDGDTGTSILWERSVNHIKFNLPESADKIINTWKSNLAYILINRDGAGIQPGSRSYERSWIRDGSLTSSALLKSGIVSEVKEFIDWYTAHQYENGKVPCVVDHRGPDPVPENDSHGEMIYLIKEYFNFTKDTTFLRSKNENVLKAVDYLESLIAERSTDHFKYGNDSVRAYYGLVPESISHEGYSAKPMHSYWDDFFTMKGLKDATEIQRILGEKENYERIKKITRYVQRKSLQLIKSCNESKRN